MSTIKDDLKAEFDVKMEDLATLDLTSKEYSTGVDNLMKVTDMINKIETSESEREMKKQQMEDEKKDRLIKNCITGLTFAGSCLVYGLAFKASMNFEKFGTLTTEGGRNSLRALLKLKN